MTTRARPRAAALLVLVAALAAAAALAFARGDDAPPRPPGLADLWAGHARLVLDRIWTSASLGRPEGGAYSGAHVEIAGGRWYLFNRTVSQERCDGRPNDPRLGTQVRESPDGGRTWGRPVPVVVPTAGTPWACAATDGDAVYDPSTTTWHYLFQCDSGAAPGWQGCAAERHAASPIGPWAAPGPPRNPVIAPGQLWEPICDDAGDACARVPGARPIVDEGTFAIAGPGAGPWWVSFHGHDTQRAYRGLARTADFSRTGWQVDGAGGTPRDAMLTAADATGWREQWAPAGPVGPGAGSLLVEGGHTYQLVEVPDRSLNCTSGQHWDLGLYRARALTGRWEPFPGGNPIAYSGRSGGGCNPAYPRLFRDPAAGTTYVMYGRASADPARDGIYLYRVAWDRNLLHNGDLWRADADGWRALPGSATQLDVPRDFDHSADGTPFLAINCGAPACAAVYQDVAVAPGDAQGAVTFGATLRAATGEQRVDVALLQLDAHGAAVSSTAVPATAGGAYARVTGRAELDGRTRTLRFQLAPRTPGTVWADDLEVAREQG